MGSAIQRPPRTIMEVFQNLPEGTLAELIDNVIYMSPSPTYQHQQVLQKIFRWLSEKITDSGRGDVIVAPFDVYLDEKSNAVQPDIVVILKENAGRLNSHGHFSGVPDLVVEVLSQSNKDFDLIEKKDLYQKFGVAEYWVVDPETRLSIGHKIANGKFEKMGEEIGLIDSSIVGASFKF